MAGAFRSGDLLLIESESVGGLRPGDVVVYNDSRPAHHRVNMVHRVIGIKPQGLICQGDNNRLPDPEPLPEERLIGRVTRFERGGRIRKIRGG